MKPDKTHHAIQWGNTGGPSFGLNEINVNLNTSRVTMALGVEDGTYNVAKVANPESAFAGSDSFIADDVEVLVTGSKSYYCHELIILS